jgi:hypothetical protein
MPCIIWLSASAGSADALSYPPPNGIPGMAAVDAAIVLVNCFAGFRVYGASRGVCVRVFVLGLFVAVLRPWVGAAVGRASRASSAGCVAT